MADNVVEVPDFLKAGSVDFENIVASYRARKEAYAAKDKANGLISFVREGQLHALFPDAFPDENSPYGRGLIIANKIEIASRTVAENLAPMPRFRCVEPNMDKDSQQARATKRTAIVNHKFKNSGIPANIYGAADNMASYGSMIMSVEPDWENDESVGRFVDPRHCYFQYDRFDRPVAFFRHVEMNVEDLILQYPDFANNFRKASQTGYGESSHKLTIVTYQDAKRHALFCENGSDSFMFDSVPNLMGRITVNEARIQTVNGVARGLYDSMIIPMVAKNQLALDNLKISRENAEAPLVVPDDVDNVEYGPNAVIRTNNPGGVQRIPHTNQTSMYQQQIQLDQEMSSQSRIPNSVNGDVNASIITGNGLDALNAGFKGDQVRVYQTQLVALFQWAAGVMLEMDEKLFGDVEKHINGSVEGSGVALKYKAKDVIKGNYTVEVIYTLQGQFSASSAIIANLQLAQGGIVSTDYVRRNLSFEIDPEEEERKIAAERSDKDIDTFISSMVQAQTAVAAQGGDITQSLSQIAKFYSLVAKGKKKSDALVEAFSPEPPPEAPEMSPEEMMMAGGAGNVQADMAAAASGQLPPGLQASGLMSGVRPGQAGQTPGGGGILSRVAANLNNRGEANASIGYSDQRAV